MTRTGCAIAASAALTMATAVVSAGGWAMVTIDTLPTRIEAGQPVNLAFFVRQHGATLLAGLQPSVEATSGDLHVSVRAASAAQTGRYTASLVLPRPGEWVISINSGFGVSRLVLLPIGVVAPGAAAPPVAGAGLGRQLFVAKGCVTCHQNDVGSNNRSLSLAPLLVANKYQDSFLASILANPAATLPRRDIFPQMPNLDLRADEISALVAFVNGAPGSNQGQTGVRPGSD